MLRAAGGDPSVMGILEMLEEAFGDFYGRNLSIYKEDEYFNGEWFTGMCSPLTW